MLVPAKDEEENIENCIKSLLAQDYPNFEIIAIDDRSKDRTLEILKSFEQKDKRIKVVEVKELPEGYTGKNHALIEGLKHTKGEWLLFIDADTVHDPRTLAAAMNYALKKDLDSLSVEPQFEWNRFFQKLTFPILALGTACMFPIFTVNKKGSKVTLSNGQYLMVKREVYEACGGHEKIKGKSIDRAQDRCRETGEQDGHGSDKTEFAKNKKNGCEYLPFELECMEKKQDKEENRH